MMKLLQAKSTMMLCLVSALVIAGCNKNPPPGEPPGEGSAALHGQGPREAPKEAYTACEGKNNGDACTVKMGDREASGKCAAPPQGASDTRLSCRPERPEKKPE